MRLDAELLARTPSYLNPLHDREINLRGHKLPAIENLGVTKDQLDSIDFTDNSITSVSNFPLLRRLSHLLLANNPVRTISATLATSLPNLRTLILTNGALPLDSLALLGEVLGKCRKLETLCCKGCPVVGAEYYKEWIVFKCKKLRSLDFERIKDKDRARAKSLFQTAEGAPTPLAVAFANAAVSASAVSTGASFAKVMTNTFEPGTEMAVTGENGNAGRLLSKEDKERVRQAIEGASSVEEIRRLTKMLSQGYLPSDKDLQDLNKSRTQASQVTATNGGKSMQTD